MNRSRLEAVGKTQPRSGETMILFSVGGSKLAIAASAVDEIRDLSGLKKFSCEPASPRFGKVKQVFERQGRRYFVVDSCEHFHLAMTRPSRLLVLRHATTAVVVDAIDCMVELNSMQALPRAFSGEERNWYRGLAVVKGRVIPVVRPESFLSSTDVAFIEASLRVGEAGARSGAGA